MSILKVVLTGGPSAGKSTMLHHLSNALSAVGCDFVFDMSLSQLLDIRQKAIVLTNADATEWKEFILAPTTRSIPLGFYHFKVFLSALQWYQNHQDPRRDPEVYSRQTSSKAGHADSNLHPDAPQGTWCLQQLSLRLPARHLMPAPTCTPTPRKALDACINLHPDFSRGTWCLQRPSPRRLTPFRSNQNVSHFTTHKKHWFIYASLEVSWKLRIFFNSCMPLLIDLDSFVYSLSVPRLSSIGFHLKRFHREKIDKDTQDCNAFIYLFENKQHTND